MKVMKIRYLFLMFLFFVTLFSGLQAQAKAKSLPTFQLEMADGKLIPSQIVAPAGQRFKIEITNTGQGAAEFESIRLHKEKVLGPGAHSFVVIHELSRGEYKFFDDFHPLTAQGSIVVE